MTCFPHHHYNDLVHAESVDSQQGISMWHRMRSLLELIRFSHTIFALPFALLSALLAWQIRDFAWLDLVGILLCMVFARSAAMAFNRLADQRFDALNPRTANRHLPSGTLTRSTVWLFLVACSVGFVASTGLFLLSDPANPWPLILSLPVLLFIAGYSLTKRFTALSHFWLGASLLLAPLSAWIALMGIDQLATPLVLGLAVFFWVAGFDIFYACQDVDFDRQAQLHSVPAWLGVAASLRVALACHILTVAMLLALWWVTPGLGTIYLAGVVAVAILLAYEHWLVRPDDLSRVNQAFFQVNGIISFGLLAVVIVQLAVGR
jgi:4-hydroxybenzoate polyprenyltransferase